MGGKGQRRREKNYKAAHGGANTRLPPPPNPSTLDAIPSKLRQIMSLSGAVKQGSNRAKKNSGNVADKGTSDSTATGSKRKRDDHDLVAQHKEHDDEDPQISMHVEKKKKKKRKNKKAEDLRFEAVAGTGAAVSQRKERKKQRLEARKKKNKKPSTEEDDMDFPGREQIKFGDIVQAPPKLNAVPKGFKKIQDASQERLRLQAVEAYRKRKGWESRPGVQLPPPVTSSSTLDI